MNREYLTNIKWLNIPTNIFWRLFVFIRNLVVISFFSLILPYLGSANLVLLAGYLVHLKFIIIFCPIVITYMFFLVTLNLLYMPVLICRQATYVLTLSWNFHVFPLIFFLKSILAGEWHYIISSTGVNISLQNQVGSPLTSKSFHIF